MESGSVKNGDESTMIWGRIASVLACILTVLMVTPFTPAMPFAGLDGAWAYAMNVATAEHLRFGSDIIFTFGPLASVYTLVYYPATDGLMIGGSLLIAIALFACLFAIVPPRRRMLLLLLPVVISLGWGRDAVFLFLPLLLPYVVTRGMERGRPYTVTLCVLAAAIGILPLVKGNFSVLMVFATIIGMIVCWRSSPRTAIMIIAVELFAMVSAWLIAGQMLADLPRYVIAQAPIISGYIDGMSVQGHWRELAVFIAFGVLLLGVSGLAWCRRHWYAPILISAYLFIAFKSGFVRHDAHALVSAVALVYIGLLLCLTQDRGKKAAFAFVASLVGWGLISSTYMPVSWDTSTARLAEMVRKPAHGIWVRLSQPGLLQVQFKNMAAHLGARPPFMGYKGVADVYPWDVGSLIAAGAVWKPRPILQSYSAYTPSLLKANAAHLASDPPPRVYFNVDPIDHRYPALEDGMSWLSLLGSFTPKAINGGYAILERTNPGKPALKPQTPEQVDASMGQEVAVVGSDQPVWVTMEIRQTLAGKLFSMLYKPPKLSLRVRYESGETADFRLVAGMTQTGFLLSPTVADAKDFVALGSTYRQDLLSKRRVVAFNVAGGSGTRFLWDLHYRVSFARLDIPPTAEADAVLAGAWKQSPGPSAYKTGGNCNIEDVDRRKVTAVAMDLPAGMVVIRGWGVIDGAKGKPNKGIALLVTARDSTSHILPASRVSRPDVADYFKHPGLEHAGFEAYLDVRQLPSDAQIRVIQTDGTGQLLCTPAMLTVHRTDAVPAHVR
ncbi:hypothetical protein [Xanthomonas sp. 3058]|uniref:hypothetical protein n=1 Tax=Xanthomonas sp. 3058 TaxID=3035314 RepID=UPI00161729FF|nr:hypothetical protein [Xanthomonas sp. 3058]MBB5864296.1 hypothetical protein [Xanthomonas sp. 3058]